jgi:hypothetical protein
MSGTIPPIPQYASMAWRSAKEQGQLYLYLYLKKRYLIKFSILIIIREPGWKI